ncbi:MAG: hypothetical protein Q7R84_02255 [bacterium]|nr:hypothetical protein [bacterium]
MAEELQEIKKMVYCDWGEHYVVDPDDLFFKDDQTTLCKECQESIASQPKKEKVYKIRPRFMKSNNLKRIVKIEMLGERWIATISFDPDGSPSLRSYDQRYEKEISALLNELAGKELPLPAGDCGVQFYKAGDEGYVFAFAHELSHYAIQGKHIRGTVKSI